MASLSAFSKPFHYPSARRDDSVVDDYFSHSIPDPYRWLEDPESEETCEFVQNQIKLTDSLLEECVLRDKLRDKITELIDFERYSPPFKRSDKYFYFYNFGLQAQNVLYIQHDLDAKADVLLDPNHLNEGAPVALKVYSVSKDAKYIAYVFSLTGSDWSIIKIMRIEDQRVEPETLSWVKYTGISWTHDSKGFFYNRFPPPNEGQSSNTKGIETDSNFNLGLYYHFVGTDQSEDILCWEDNENPRDFFEAQVTEDGEYLLLVVSHGVGMKKKVYYVDLTTLPNGLESLGGGKELLPFTKLVEDFHAYYGAVANDGTVFTFETNKDAPRYKLVRVDLKSPGVWTDVIPQSDRDVLESAHAVNANQLLVRYLSNVKNVLQIRDLETGSLLHTLPLDIGSVDTIHACRSDTVAFFRFTSFLTPGIIYQCDFQTGAPELKIFKENTVRNLDRSVFEVNQVFVSSKDGTQIPIFIMARKGISLDGSHPCLLTGYGGFDISILPSFSASRLVLLKHLDAVFCSANLRGGGEYGEEWHKAGSRDKKQNVFDDFISAAEFLVSHGYTEPKKLCIEGGSNGGLLVGACVTQRPDLFGCAIANCGPMDMLRLHKFTVGHCWTPEFGCSDNEEEFNWLIKYSPLHNVRRPWETSVENQSQYPAVMLLTADHDDRAVPMHTLKMLATMQYVLCKSLEKSPQKNPIIARIECNVGHYGKPTLKQIDEAADRYGFMAKVVDASWID